MAEMMMGSIVFAADESKEYALYHVIFTDQRVVGILATQEAFAALQNSMGSSGIGSALLNYQQQAATMNYVPRLRPGNVQQWMQERQKMRQQQAVERMQMNMEAWNAVKKDRAGQPWVTEENGELPQQIQPHIVFSETYDKVKEVRVSKKVLGQGDYNINLHKGLLGNTSFEIPEEAVDAAVQMLQKTPLGPKLQVKK